MPHKTKTGWKWANVKRKTKGELAKTVYGIWKKNGSKGSFSDFWRGKDDGENANESEVLSIGETVSSINGLKTINNSRIGSERMNTKTNNATTLVESWGTPWQRITRNVIAEADQLESEDDDPNVIPKRVSEYQAIAMYCVKYLTVKRRNVFFVGPEDHLFDIFRLNGGNKAMWLEIVNKYNNLNLDEKSNREIAQMAVENLEKASQENVIAAWELAEVAKHIQRLIADGNVDESEEGA